MLILFDACESLGILKTVMFIMNIVKIICIIAPILLMLMLMIDFAKNVISKDEEETKKNFNKSIKRIIACILIFFVPTIVAFIMNILGDLGVDYAKCITNANSEYIALLEQKEKNKFSSTSSTTKSTTKPSSSSSTNTKEATEKSKPKTITFKLDKDFIVLGHYNGNRISKKKIIIYNDKGKKLSNKRYFFKISKPIATIDSNGKITAQFAGKATIKVIDKNDSKNYKKIKLVVIKATYTKAVTNKKVTAYNLSNNSKVKLPKGASGIYNGAAMDLPKDSNTKFYYHGDILKVDNNYYQVPYTSVTPIAYYVSKPYSQEVAEEFINSNNFSSNTKYLFWVDQGTEMNYYFELSRGKWHLKNSFEINTGDVLGLNARYNGGNCNGTSKNSTFSDSLGECNSFSDNQVDIRRLDKNYKGSWVGLKYAVFNHKDNGGGWLGAWHEGYSAPREPKSHGCVRHRSQVMIWIRDNYHKFAGSRIINF